MPKYIFVTGGVMSGLGKGVVAASLAKLLQMTGLRVTCIKIDPYLNVDAGTMNPIIHGEVFVTDDGGETDMDLGTYERFLNQNLSMAHNITTGQVYKRVIENERQGLFLGRCVQIIPHITDEIKRRIREASEKDSIDVALVECGGTVGDIESLPYLEAFRQMRLEQGADNTLFVHVTLAPVLETVGEQKTKPTQHSVQELRRIGIQPDMIVVRCKTHLRSETRSKISLFTSVEPQMVISNPDVETVYKVPETLQEQQIVESVCSRLKLGERKVEWDSWRVVADSFLNRDREVKIAMVGKYTALADSYVSVNQALLHAGACQGVRVRISWVDAEEFEKDQSCLKNLQSHHGILIPGGFGKRGSEGKMLASNYALQEGIPHLGLCFGFQLAVASFARNVCHMQGANSTELNPNTSYPVIDLLPEQRGVVETGGTMHLGGHDIHLVQGTKAHEIYGRSIIRERHRHRYELNQKYRANLEADGIRFSGFSDAGRRAEILEVSKHPFYMATQYHPEFLSRPGAPEPIFLAFVVAVKEKSEDYSKARAPMTTRG